MLYSNFRQKSFSFIKNLFAPAKLFEAVPLLFILTLVLIKLVVFSLLLPGSWWGQGESFQDISLYFFHAIYTKTHIFTATLACLLILVAFFPLVSRSRRYLLLLILNLFITTLGVAEIVHVRFYADVMSISDLVNAHVLKGLMPNILKNLKSTDILYYLDIFIAFLIYPFYIKADRRIPAVERRYRARFSFAIMIFGIILALPTVWEIWQNKNRLFSSSSLRIDIASDIGILPYHLSEIFILLFGENEKIGEPERERARQFLDEERARKRGESPLFGAAKGMNVIVISAESLQAFPIGLKINGQEITPRLNEFAAESLQFTNYYDQTHLGTTSDAEFMVMQSLHPLPAGVLSSSYYKNQFRALPKILSDHNYSTISLCGAPEGFWNMDKMHAGFGFQKSYFEKDFDMTERIHEWLSDNEFFRQSVEKIKQQKEPFMAFLLSSSNHHPYDIPNERRELDLGELEGKMIGDYFHSVHYFDKSFGKFVDKLRESELLEKSIIVIYGDHQGFLQDSAEFSKILGIAETDTIRKFLVRKKIPLLIRLPGKKAYGIRTTAGGHLDVAPTILGLLGIVDEKTVMLGDDLTKKTDFPVVFRDGSFIKGSYLYLNKMISASGVCYEISQARPVDCAALEIWRQKASERLLFSDMIVRGNLIPTLFEDNKK